MELFRTVINCTASPEKIGYDSHILMLGSCFAEYIGSRMIHFKFPIVLNPFGMMYNPVSVAQGIERIISAKPYSTDELQQHHDLWCSFDHHGRFSNPDINICLQSINTELSQANQQLLKADWLIITFGTAWVYRLIDTGRVVNNCHKFPASTFERFRLNPDEICILWKQMLTLLRKVNPKLRLLFTISPIRHLRDGAHENQLSKASLLLAIEQLCKQHNDIAYFPAYEIVLDELRDYRFYADDMTHPSAMAVDYIWKRFCDSYISNDTFGVMKQIDDIIKASEHRPLHRTLEYFRFADSYMAKIEYLQQRFSMMDFTKEKAALTHQQG